MEFPFGAALGAGASLVGGLINAGAQNRAQQAAENNFSQQWRLQQQMAQGGLTWRAHDAMKAYKETGIHPLSMLGVNAPSYSPISYVGGANTAAGDAISAAGQGLGRAIDATASERDRLAHASRLDSLVHERAGLENELLRVRIASEVAQIKQNANPSMPVGNRWLVDGQGNAPTGPLIKEKPMERSPSDPVNKHTEPGAVTDLGFSRTKSGYAPTRSKDLQDRAEDDAIGSVTWNIRNRLMPTFGLNMSPPYKAPLGFEWRYAPFHQEYRLYKKSGTYKRIEFE